MVATAAKVKAKAVAVVTAVKARAVARAITAVRLITTARATTNARAIILAKAIVAANHANGDGLVRIYNHLFFHLKLIPLTRYQFLLQPNQL